MDVWGAGVILFTLLVGSTWNRALDTQVGCVIHRYHLQTRLGMNLPNEAQNLLLTQQARYFTYHPGIV